MSEGFHRSFTPAAAEPVVGLFPVRKRDDRWEIWGLLPTERHVAHQDEGELSISSLPLEGASSALLIQEWLDHHGFESKELSSAGRWESCASASKRYAWELYLVEVQDKGEAEDGEWRDLLDWWDGFEKGQSFLGPLFAHVIGANKTGEHDLPEWGEVMANRGASARIRIARGVQVMPLLTPTLPPATHTNCVIAAGGDCVVVDPASPYPDEQQRLRDYLNERLSQGERVSRIVLTHHHQDHVGGVTALRKDFDVPVAAHPMTAEKLKGHVIVDEFLEDGDVIPYGNGGFLRVLHTPGHASGHVVLHQEEEGWAIVGDMVAGQGTIVIDPPDGNMLAYLSQLNRLKALSLRAMIPAHGGVILEPEALISHYVKHRLWREGVIEQVVAQQGPVSIPAIVPEAYGDVSPMVYPIAARQVEAHLEKLEAEGRVIRELGPRFRLSASARDPR